HQLYRHRAGDLRAWLRACRLRRRDERPLLQRDQFRHRALSRRDRLLRRHHRRPRQHLWRDSRRLSVRRLADHRHGVAAVRQRLQGCLRFRRRHRLDGLAADRADPRKDQRARVMAAVEAKRASLWPGIATLAAATGYLIALLAVEKSTTVIALIGGGIAVVVAAAWLGLLGGVSRAFVEHEDALGFAGILALVIVAAVFRDDHFVLLLVITALLYSVATLGLNVQFGYAGVLNFAGASFFGIGAYTSAVLNTYTAIPHLIVPLIGGVMAAVIGSLLLAPVLRTRGHYAAVVTIAFALLFKTFLEVNDVLGGPQGMQVPSMQILGWSFNDNIDIGALSLSFYINYYVISLLLLIASFVV